MKNIINELRKGTSIEKGFSAKSIKDYKSFMIGIDSSDQIVFFIKPKNFLSTKQPHSSKTKFLNISFEVECEVNLESITSIDKYILLSLRSNNNLVEDIFINICKDIMQILGDNTDYEKAIELVNSLRDMFSKLINTGRKEEIGLWGELFVICISSNKELLIDSWHINNSDTFDFNDGNTKLEIKTTCKGERIHRISLNQILKSIESKSLICSIMTSEIELGKSVNDLIDEINQSVDHNYKIKLMERVMDAAGNNILNFKAKFDFTTAISSYKFYKATSIPSINQNLISPEISNIKFDTNLEGITEENVSRKTGFLSYLTNC